ncbi:hypothetical protein CFK39_06410 [Brachybacterium avium]|uniref:Fibronectin type-III domain-containing protein n=1 Tax=Brachybacterium avium TaxID=2017485 RepID=A0A220UC82_9MICO|nr:hypothetical protein [Brachybacterium avium]ASK65526.1 hypothetical protein CFK39_06410 [Brachybacterium avium]
MSAWSRALRTRVAMVCIAALMLTAAFASGTDSEAMWTDGKAGSGTFTALQLGGVQNFVCTAGVWSAATVNWARPTGTPGGVVSYQVTVRRAGKTETTTQAATTFTYRRPALNFDDVTLTVQPVIEQWTGPTRTMILEAAPLVGMRCP